MHFKSIYAAAFFILYGVALAIALVLFIKNIIAQDHEYEMFLPWSVRFLIYGIGYSMLPIIGLGIGLYLIRKDNPLQRKFAKGSIFISIAYTCFWIAGCFGISMT